MKERIRSFKDLHVWKKAYELCLSIYRISQEFPKYELYCITAQMRRSAISVSSNIAEGYSRKNRKEYVHFLYVAYGSLSELETQILLSKDLGYMQQYDLEQLLKMKEEIGAMMYKLIKTLSPEPCPQQCQLHVHFSLNVQRSPKDMMAVNTNYDYNEHAQHNHQHDKYKYIMF